MTAPRVFVLDNYDSFTFNLVQHLGMLGADLHVTRNDRVSTDEVVGMSPDGVVISPGPGTPDRAGISEDLVLRCAQERIPLLGVCLGHQAIGEAFGGRIVRSETIMHGKTSLIHHNGGGVLRGLPDPFEATRYHSLIVEAESLPSQLDVTARTNDGVIMAIRHTMLPIEGVQFHPESILTGSGVDLLRNFLGSLDATAPASR